MRLQYCSAILCLVRHLGDRLAEFAADSLDHYLLHGDIVGCVVVGLDPICDPAAAVGQGDERIRTIAGRLRGCVVALYHTNSNKLDGFARQFHPSNLWRACLGGSVAGHV